MLWALLNGLIGLIIFFGSYFIFGKDNEIHSGMLGIMMGKKDFFKTLLLGAVIAFFFFMILYLVYYLFHID